MKTYLKNVELLLFHIWPHLIQAYTDGIAKFSKTFRPSRRNTPFKPWISPSILCCINRKNKLYKKCISKPTNQRETRYKQYRNILTGIIRDAKKSYFEKAFEDSKHDGKKTWQVISEVINKRSQAGNLPSKFIDEDHIEYDDDKIATGFNNFFTSIGQKLDSKMPPSNTCPLSFLTNPTYPAFASILSTTENQVETIIKSLNQVGGGVDKISTKILIGTYKHVLHHITHFLNICLSNATFPDMLKIALVKPIYKAGEKNKFTNYRPISLLPIFSKILEKIIKEYFQTYLDQNYILSKSQFGFRKKHSTYMPVTLSFEDITKSLEHNEKMIGLYVDLKKTFDTVDLTILLKKLYFIGIRGGLYDIIK